MQVFERRCCQVGGPAVWLDFCFSRVGFKSVAVSSSFWLSSFLYIFFHFHFCFLDFVSLFDLVLDYCVKRVHPPPHHPDPPHIHTHLLSMVTILYILCVCVCVCGCVCVCVCERARAREGVCVCLRERERVRGWVCV